jgi:hypothetical protein
VIHTQGVRAGAGQITISYQLILESEPTPPSEEPTTPPVEEPATPPTEEPATPPTEEPATPPVTEETPTPESSQATSPEPIDLDAVPSPESVEELAAPIAKVIPNQPQGNNSDVAKSATEDFAAAPVPSAQDEIIQQPTNLRQSAQTVVVPVQDKKTPWSFNSLFAGLIGLGVFALIVGLVVARRGVPGAIAS